MSILKNIILVVIICIGAYFLSPYFGIIYLKVFPSESAGSFLNGRALIGLPLSYILISTALFTAFGGTKKYWWMGILLIPAALFEVYFDWIHLYFPILLGLVGWVVGWGVAKLTARR